MSFSKTKKYTLLLPLMVLVGVFLLLLNQNALSVEGYLAIQKDGFFLLNKKLSKYSVLQYNLTQLGDAFIVLSLFSVCFIKFPKIWKSLIAASLVSLFLSKIPKKLFDIPRPAAVYPHDSFIIIGKTLQGHSSFPSGHSITIFTWIIIMLLYFAPKHHFAKMIWWIIGITIGLFIALSRVAVGAHHPLDVVCGAAIGSFSAILGILLILKYPINWMDNKKLYPLFIAVFSVGFIVLLIKMIKEPLVIYFFPLISLLVSIYFILKHYGIQKMYKSSASE